MLDLVDNSTNKIKAEYYFTPLIFGDFVNVTFNASWIVVDTDYDNYALVTMCDTLNWFYWSSHLFVLSRNQTLSASVRNDI
jgi:hypothetical protein